MKSFRLCAAAAACLLAGLPAHAVSLDGPFFKGSFDSTIGVGFGLRTQDPGPSLVLVGNTGGPVGLTSPLSGLGDQGTLNYGKRDFFTQYLKGSHELLLQLPYDLRFMGRVNWVRDFKSTDTTGWLSSGSTNPEVTRDGLSDEARKDLRFKARVLDLWLSKSFQLGDQQARLRVGNQVVSWGESIITPGGINATNQVDVMRLSQPGTQLKEGILPAPIVSLATGVAPGLNAEVYVQTRWKPSYLPPTGSYWSVVNGLGRGHAAYGTSEGRARNSGQWGAALKWEPAGTSLNLGLYAMAYHDKAPQLSLAAGPELVYPEDRRLIGVSANFPLGDWAIGTELSYRPKDAVGLNFNDSGCSSQAGRCWVDEKKLQWHLTGLLQLSPSNAGGLLQALGASNGLLLTELVVIHFPKLQQVYGGIDSVAAGGWGWGNEVLPPAASRPTGTKTSAGLNVDASLTFDGGLLPGWQVTPGVFMSYALAGRTPNVQGTWMKGALNANLYLNFSRNPGTWQFGLNYSVFRGGSSVFDQPFRDRDFVGGYVNFNF